MTLDALTDALSSVPAVQRSARLIRQREGRRNAHRDRTLTAAYAALNTAVQTGAHLRGLHLSDADILSVSSDLVDQVPT